MITKPTVLVLGAGASKPYGYPLGGELVREVWRSLNVINGDFVNALVTCGIERETITNFHAELYYSHQPSVDAFLEHRPEFRDVGKLAIALALLQKEDETILNNFDTRKAGLYDYLYSQLNASWEEFSENKLSIVTFNYDRSLEHFLFTALKNSYGKSDDLVADAVSKIPIVHVHGSLGPLPWQEKNGRPYKIINTKAPIETAEQIEPASKNILIVSEVEKSTNEFDRAFECLKAAKRIYFLGFGYHEPNLKKLRINEIDISRTSKEGSALNLGAAQRRVLSTSWNIVLGNNKLNDLEFLKEYAELD